MTLATLIPLTTGAVFFLLLAHGVWSAERDRPPEEIAE